MLLMVLVQQWQHGGMESPKNFPTLARGAMELLMVLDQGSGNIS